MHLHRLSAFVFTALAILVSGTHVTAQTVTLDEGTFRLTVSGQEVGSETFSVRQTGTGENAVIVANGRVALDSERGGQELSASLEVAGAALRPAAYQVNVQGGESQKIAGRVVGGRFTARIVSPAGEMMREYLASDGAVLIDEGVAHHYYFLARRLDNESTMRIAVIVPRLSKQLTAEVTARGSEPIEIAGKSTQARHLVVTIPGSPERHVWTDAAGRVLRLEIPGRNYLAQRTSLP
jgi:hypothetical protein